MGGFFAPAFKFGVIKPPIADIDDEGGDCPIAVNRNPRSLRILLPGCFAVYLIAVLWYTIGKRSTGYYSSHFDLFWSYKLWFDGDREYGRAILANIAMLIPFGFLLSAMGNGRQRKSSVSIFLSAAAFSLLIETIQFIAMRGHFEADDVFNNTLGALIGILFFLAVRRFMPGRLLRNLLLAACAGIMLFCVGLYALSKDDGVDSANPLSQGLCFQVEDASYADGKLNLSGVCFWYHQGPGDCTVVLQSTQTGKRFSLQTESGLLRPDVAAYFHRDSVKAGFRADGHGIEPGEEYEIMLDFGLFRSFPTAVYLTVENSAALKQAAVDIHYVPSGQFHPLEVKNTDLEKIVSDGTLRVYDPDNHVYVYFHEGSLYWIVEEGFAFRSDSLTRLELLLWTTDTVNLPEKSRATGREWDLFGVYFERDELEGNFGRYRVCVKKLKDLNVDYPIASIKTGRYANGWIWKANFWPVYSFSP